LFYISLHKHLVDNICGDNFNFSILYWWYSILRGMDNSTLVHFVGNFVFHCYWTWLFHFAIVIVSNAWDVDIAFIICQMFVSLVNPILHWLLVMVRFLVPCVIAKAKLKDWHHFRCWDCIACSYIRSNCTLRTAPAQLFHLD